MMEVSNLNDGRFSVYEEIIFENTLFREEEMKSFVLCIYNQYLSSNLDELEKIRKKDRKEVKLRNKET